MENNSTDQNENLIPLEWMIIGGQPRVVVLIPTDLAGVSMANGVPEHAPCPQAADTRFMARPRGRGGDPRAGIVLKHKLQSEPP